MAIETTAPTNTPQSAMAGFMGNIAEGMKEIQQTTADIAPPPVETPKPQPAPKPVVQVDQQQSTKPDDKAKPQEAPESDDKWPRSAQEWKHFRKSRDEKIGKLNDELKTWQTKATEYESKLKTAPVTADPKVLEAIQKERDELSERLRVVDVTNHPKFQQYFEGRTNSQIELAKGIVGKEKAEKFTTLLSMPDSDIKTVQLENAMADLTPVQQARLGGILNSLAEISNERQFEISKAKENYERIQQQHQSTLQEQKKQFENMLATELTKAQADNMAFQTREKDEAWNASVQKRIDTVKNLFNPNVAPDTAIRAAIEAVAYRPVLEHASALHEENSALKAQIAELTSASPSLQSKSPGGSDPVRVVVKPGSNPHDAMKGFISNLQSSLNNPPQG